MSRKLLFAAPLILAACGSSGTVSMEATSDDAGDNALSVTAYGTDLTTVKSVNVTVDEIWAHVEDAKEAKDSVTGENVADDDKKWELVSSDDVVLDLMTVRNSATKPLGDIAMPAGKITQIRLKLKGTTAEGDRFRIAGAVTETDGTVCDLTLPKSAINPGVKISGVFKAMQIENGGKYHAIINIKLKDSSKDTTTGTCTYRLNPEMKVKKYEVKN